MSIFHHTISREYRIIRSVESICSLFVPVFVLQSRDTYISFFGKVKEGKWKDGDCCAILSKKDEQTMYAKLEEIMHKRISADKALGISVTVLPDQENKAKERN